MTKEEFICRHRGEMLLFLAEAWAIRGASHGELALTMDRHHLRCRKILADIYDELCPPPEVPTGIKAGTNGRASHG